MIALIKYNSGNNVSVMNALNRLQVEYSLTDDPKVLEKADKVIFPGVGAARPAMDFLKESGLDKVIPKLTVPFLGICLGQQLLCKHSEEGDTPCLGIFDIEVKKFEATEIVPHMGWNSFTEIKSDLFKNIEKDNNVFFVHSYYCELSEHTIAKTNYGIEFSAAIQKNNFYATQFHLEKSGKVGEQILKNFISI